MPLSLFSALLPVFRSARIRSRAFSLEGLFYQISL